MYIKQVEVTNFGPFDTVKVDFTPNCLNVIKGNNCTGKTQLFGAILASLVGKSALRFDRGGIAPSIAATVLSETNYSERVLISCSLDSNGAPNVTQNVELLPRDVSNRRLGLDLLSAISDPDSPSLFIDFTEVDRVRLSNSDVSLMTEHLPNSLRHSRVWRTLRQSDAFMGVAHSHGEQQFAQLIRELAVRQPNEPQPPLIVDNFYGLDREYLTFAYDLLEVVAERAQVILFTSEAHIARGKVVASLNDLHRAALNFASYNGSLTIGPPRLRIDKAHRGYVLGQRYPLHENRLCELKEVKGKNPASSIKSTVDQYVVAYLNASDSPNGAIIWGVRDHDRIIVGVRLSDAECDTVRRVVTEKLHQITPAIAPTAYRVTLHAVSDGVRAIPGLYLVEVSVPSTRRTTLFSTGSQDVYIKTDAGKKKLTAMEIQQEVLRRCGIDGILY